MAAFNGLYDFDVIPYAGDLTKYGQGPGHQWFDFYSGQDEGGPEEEETEEAVDPGTEQQQQGGPDGGNVFDIRGQGRDQAKDPSREAINRDLLALMDMITGVSPVAAALGFGGMGKEQIGPSIPAFGMNDAVADEIAAAAAGDGYSGGVSSPAEAYSGPDWSGPSVDPSAGDGEQGGLGGNRDGGWRNGGRIQTSALPPPRFIRGPGDGRSDSVPAFANGGMKLAQLSNGEFVWPADAVSAVGRGSSEAGARKLGQAAQAIRQQHMARMSALPPPGR